MTRHVWDEIIAGSHVAQALVASGERTVAAQAPSLTFKFDLRDYVYNGEVQWVPVYEGTQDAQAAACAASSRCAAASPASR